MKQHTLLGRYVINRIGHNILDHSVTEFLRFAEELAYMGYFKLRMD